MHRFNLCHDLLEGVEDDEEALALLFAWLRYSATRQLDWQRRYNTQPRELSHAQDRLTKRLAGIWRRQQPRDALAGAGGRTWVRLMLTTLGRGGDGQRVRDEILHIMHRNHIKEASGTFMEEWHQKLHNNTTPDDVVICDGLSRVPEEQRGPEPVLPDPGSGRRHARTAEGFRAADQDRAGVFRRPEGRADPGLRELPADPQVRPFGDRSGKRRRRGPQPAGPGTEPATRRALLFAATGSGNGGTCCPRPRRPRGAEGSDRRGDGRCRAAGPALSGPGAGRVLRGLIERAKPQPVRPRSVGRAGPLGPAKS